MTKYQNKSTENRRVATQSKNDIKERKFQLEGDVYMLCLLLRKRFMNWNLNICVVDNYFLSPYPFCLEYTFFRIYHTNLLKT